MQSIEQYRELLQRRWFFLVRILLGLLVCVSLGIGVLTGTNWLLNLVNVTVAIRDPLANTLTAIAVLLLYSGVYRLLENRNITELNLSHNSGKLLLGLLTGLALQGLIFWILYLFDGYAVVSTNPVSGVVAPLVTGFADAVIAEIVLIGIFFRITEGFLGSWLTLLTLALVFIVLHGTNPNGSLISALAISMHGAFLLGAAFILTRNLWFPIAIHFAWDFSQVFIFGGTLSGSTMPNSIFTARLSGSPLLTGGYFGTQGALQAGLLCALLACYFLYKGKRNLLPPAWKK